MSNIFKREKRDIMGEIVASNVHSCFLDGDANQHVTVLRKTDYMNGCRQITEGICPKKISLFMLEM